MKPREKNGMLLSASTQVLAKRHGDAEAICILKKAGFDAFDLALFSMNQPDDKAYAKELRAIADACGIRCNQAHAPFPSGSGGRARNEVILGAAHRLMV